MSERPYHKSLRLENLTAFADASFEFVPGVNVFVGENGTGKSHAMKTLYAALHRGSQQPLGLGDILERIFQTEDVTEIVRMFGAQQIARVSGASGNGQWYYEVHRADHQLVSDRNLPQNHVRPVFIPAIDMMGHTKGFLAANNELVLDFDLTCLDIVTLLSLKRRNGAVESTSIDVLSSLLGGNPDLDEATGRFFLTTPGGRLAMPLVAEGIRKIATLVRLYQNGWLAPGSTLFWDEPEVNLNPKVMDEVVGALLELARSGVQIFLATHSYVILKELDLQANRADNVRYFAFQNSDSGTIVNWTDDFALLEPNPILDQYDSLYDRDLTRATGRNRHGEPVR